LIFLDSAQIEAAQRANDLGFVHGITTNPKLIAATLTPAHEVLRALLDVFPNGPIFYQPASPENAHTDLSTALTIDEKRVVAKLPALSSMFSLGVELVKDGVEVAFTAVFAPAQAVLAAEVGADWVIPYVDRASRHGQGNLVSVLADVLKRIEAPTRLLAASLKTPRQAVDALLDGANAVSVPLDVLEQLPQSDMTDSAVREFSNAAKEAQ
jgi:TalC/MipB family fructose-6-phosphate aldolase